MARAAPIRVAEFERVLAPEGVKQRELEGRLLRATEHVPFEVFKRTRSGLQAAGVVGLVDDGDVCVELLPKAGVLGPDPEQKASTELLLNLLTYAGLTPRAVPLDGKVARSQRPLLEAIARGFANTLVRNLTDGVPRRYREWSGWAPVIRGRLEMGKLAKRPLAVDGRLPVRYAPLQVDHELNRVIASTAGLVAQLTRSSQTWSILQFCLAHLDEVRAGHLTIEMVDGVQLGRTELHWKPVLDMARLLARKLRPVPVKSGRSETLSLVFPVNDLFEEVLRRALPKAMAPHRVALAPRRMGGRLLRSSSTGKEAITLKPDFLFSGADDAELLLVGDAKWKILDQSNGFGLEESDVYQLVTYMTRHRLETGVLLFPLQPWMLDKKGAKRWSHQFEIVDAPEVRLSLVGVDIAGLVSRDAAIRASAEKDLGVLVSEAHLRTAA